MTDINYCPCGSGASYDNCCKPLHKGKAAKDALALMRSRYCAYALHLPEYIIKTTHLKNLAYSEDKKTWKQEILAFCKATQFNRLEIQDFKQQDNSATVTFVAHLDQGGKDATFMEKSFFEKINGQWLYREGEVHPLKTPS